MLAQKQPGLVGVIGIRIQLHTLFQQPDGLGRPFLHQEALGLEQALPGPQLGQFLGLVLVSIQLDGGFCGHGGYEGVDLDGFWDFILGEEIQGFLLSGFRFRD